MSALCTGLSTDVCTVHWSVNRCLHCALVCQPMSALCTGLSTDVCTVHWSVNRCLHCALSVNQCLHCALVCQLMSALPNSLSNYVCITHWFAHSPINICQNCPKVGRCQGMSVSLYLRCEPFLIINLFGTMALPRSCNIQPNTACWKRNYSNQKSIALTWMSVNREKE